ncbi:hypothetical protein LPJ56_000885 [Coemansia sp. RSA 2599]|nr:hypothetical protein LPJ75_000482 [Coemansia sp. RSA 2598]KAJ1828786.1 hypothetical protein LPJ56_000885 [Coemansia sp. RSA 2599]
MQQAAESSKPGSQATTTRDAKLVDVLFSSALDGEFVRDQLTGTYKPHDYTASSTTQSSTIEANKARYKIPEELKSALETLERQAIRTAESGQLDEAIGELSKILSSHRYYSSAYNNRAQVYRLMGNLEDALRDLDRAIEYAQEERVLGQAYTQKAIILRSKGDQDGAYYNFSMGARLGNEVAIMAAPKENPYAKLCGKMVSEAMRQLAVPNK